MDNTISYKLCSGCNKVKPTSDFHRDRTTDDGLYSLCKWCKGVDGRAWRKVKRLQADQTSASDLDAGFKTCTRCKKERSLEEFHHNRGESDGHDKWCKPCRSELARTKYRANPRHPVIARERYLKGRYGITQIDYLDMLKAQNGLCACCGQEETAFDERTNSFRQLAVDHDHKTGKIRALLCRACNESFGLLKEDPERIQALLAYALKHKETS